MTEDEATVAAAAHPSGPERLAQPRRPGNPETLRLYALDWTSFETWCAAAGLAPLPATAATVAAFLTEAAPDLSAGTLARRASAIAARHRQRGFAVPTLDRAVKAVLRTARRNAVPRRSLGPAPTQLMRLAAACGGDLAGLRDRALLLLMAASGLGPAALVGLDVEHVRFTARAAELTLDAGSDRTGERDWVGRITVPCDADRGRCPVQALRDWLQTSDTRFGPVFRKIDRWGNIEHRRFGIAAVRQIVRRRTRRRARRAGPAIAA
jgi:site-specific recombinase XerC